MRITYHHDISRDSDDGSSNTNIWLKQPFLDHRKQGKLIEVDANEHGGLELDVLGIVPSPEFIQIDPISNIIFIADQSSAKA